MKIAAMAGFLAAGALWAAPPPGANPAWGEWFRSLKSPITGMSCCDLSDGRTTSARPTADGWEAQTPLGEWVKVPNAVILRVFNPTGQPVLFWRPATGVICFVEPPLT